MPDGHLTEEDAIRYNADFAHAAWVGLYHRNLFENVRFPVGKLFEEAAVTHKLIHAARTICLVNSALYNYRVGRSGSITSTPETRNHSDLLEMMSIKANDLYNWGYEAYAASIAITLLAKYNRRDTELRQLDYILRNVENPSLLDINWRKKAMVSIYRVSPALFDIISVLTGRRKL